MLVRMDLKQSIVSSAHLSHLCEHKLIGSRY